MTSRKMFRVGWGVCLSFCLLGCQRLTIEKPHPEIKGTGAAGYISVSNASPQLLEINFGGIGCAGISDRGHELHCDTQYIGPGKKFTYGYNWGVTETWIWVADPTLSESTDIKKIVYTLRYETSTCLITKFDKEHIKCESPKTSSLLNLEKPEDPNR